MHREIPKNVIDFIPVAVELAYSNAKRACKGIGKFEGLKKQALEKIIHKLEDYLSPTFENKKSFDDYHKDLCKVWVDVFGGKAELEDYGKAQKIINMTFKYLYTFSFVNNKISDKDSLSRFNDCHFTLDSYTLKWLYKQKEEGKKVGVLSKESLRSLKCLRADTKWSKLTDVEYMNIYKYAYEHIRNFYKDWTPLQIEYIVWDGVNLWNSLDSAYKAILDYPDEKIKNEYKGALCDPGNLLIFIDRLIIGDLS